MEIGNESIVSEEFHIDCSIFCFVCSSRESECETLHEVFGSGFSVRNFESSTPCT